jgi:hypothetical protein
MLSSDDEDNSQRVPLRSQLRHFYGSNGKHNVYGNEDDEDDQNSTNESSDYSGDNDGVEEKVNKDEEMEVKSQDFVGGLDCELDDWGGIEEDDAELDRERNRDGDTASDDDSRVDTRTDDEDRDEDPNQNSSEEDNEDGKKHGGGDVNRDVNTDDNTNIIVVPDIDADTIKLMIDMLHKGEIKLPAKVVQAKAKQTVIDTAERKLPLIYCSS